MTALRLENVSVRRGGREIVRDLDLVVERGEWLGLIGPNGAGKTTALAAIAGLVPAHGAIEVLGRPASSLRRRALARAVAYVPQEPVLPAAMRVFDYVLLGRTPHLGYLGREGARDRERVLDALAELGDEALAERALGTLSGGERQRVVLARALVQEAPVLLLDEPTSALDVGHEQRVLGLIARLRASTRELTVVAAMHDLTLASQFADRLLLLSRGRAVGAGRAREVLTEEAIEEHYGASVRVLPAREGEPVAVLPRRPPQLETPPREAPEPPPRRRARSLVLLHTGDGKGKSTAAFGVVMRAVARGWPVVVVQALKSGRWRVGEEDVCRRLGVEWRSIGDGFTWDSPDLDESAAVARASWEAAREAIASDRYRLVVLDEITYPLNWGWIDLDEVVVTIRSRPERVNVLLTGRDAPAALVDLADTATEMRKLKHAYDQGIVARRGIDF